MHSRPTASTVHIHVPAPGRKDGGEQRTNEPDERRWLDAPRAGCRRRAAEDRCVSWGWRGWAGRCGAGEMPGRAVGEESEGRGWGGRRPLDAGWRSARAGPGLRGWVGNGAGRLGARGLVCRCVCVSVVSILGCIVSMNLPLQCKKKNAPKVGAKPGSTEHRAS